MRWFRRRRRTPAPRGAEPWGDQRDPADAARAFWQRWYRLQPALSAALGDREPYRYEHELAETVAALHPDLHFTVELGHRALYALVISGQEDPALRPYTDAWKAAAPPEDAIWEYHDSVPPVPDPTKVTVNLGASRISLADVRVVAQIDEAAGVVDVAVHHPEMANLEQAARRAITFLPLDATLGERTAAQRLRRVETAVHEPAGTIGLLELRELVDRLTGHRTGPDERPGDR